MSAPTGPDPRDGLYSKLIEDDVGPFSDFSPELRHTESPSSVHPSAARRGPALSTSPGLRLSPGLYRASTVALAALCVVLLICLIAVSTHKQSKATSGAEEAPQTQQQKQQVNISELQSTIVRLQEENRRLWERINATKVNQPTVSPPRCPDDWLPFNGSCYLVSRRSRSWSDSQEYCASQGAHLAIILTAEEQTFVWDQLPRGHWNAYWIGITDAHTEDQWRWVDGMPLVRGFWEEGEPNNHIDEDCGYIVKTHVLERVAIRSWYDAPCTMYWPFVCEKNLPEAVAPTAHSN